MLLSGLLKPQERLILEQKKYKDTKFLIVIDCE